MRSLVVAAVFGSALVLGVGSPAGAGTPGSGGPSDGGLRALCARAAERPPGGAELTTDPPPKARLRAGDTVSVTLRWDERAFAGPELGRVAHCVVTLDGRLRLDLSGWETPSANDGRYQGSFVLPAELAPGDCLCVLGIAAGDRPDGGPRELGGSSCVTVTDPAPPSPPATTPPATTPLVGAPPAGDPPARPPASVLPATQTAPDPAVIPAGTTPLPLAELPRTGGPADTRFLLALAGLALVAGGGGIAARRPV